MKLLLSSLLLASLCAVSVWSVSSTPVVTQSPDVSVMEGETVNITCCWTLEFFRVRINWLKNQTDIKSVFLTNQAQGESLQNETSACSTLTFTNVTREVSGRYICRVTTDIPLYIKVEGNGTVVTVTARDNTLDTTAKVSGSHLEEVLIFVVRCLPIVALVITVLTINRLVQKHTAAARGNKLTLAQRLEENQEEEEGDERGLEAE